jgi:hypothetical protein
MVEATRMQFNERFECDDFGELTEYIGCKIEYDREEKHIKVTQPVLIQTFVDGFKIDPKYKPSTPAEPGSVLAKCEERVALSEVKQTEYRSGTDKLLHLMSWSRPVILNAVRELSKHMQVACGAHLKAMLRVMSYVVGSDKKGLKLKPKGVWDENMALEIKGASDANYATDMDSRKSVSGFSVFLNEAPISFKSVQKKVVTLSTTEVELFTITQCAQEMLFVMHVIESLQLKVKKPMKMYCDNKGAVQLTNNWSIGGRTRHVEVRQYFMRDLKELKILMCEWMSGKQISSDMFTKNLDKATFELNRIQSGGMLVTEFVMCYCFNYIKLECLRIIDIKCMRGCNNIVPPPIRFFYLYPSRGPRRKGQVGRPIATYS